MGGVGVGKSTLTAHTLHMCDMINKEQISYIKALYALKNALNHFPTVAKVPHFRRISAAFPPH